MIYIYIYYVQEVHSNPFYIMSYYIKWVTTFWTHSIYVYNYRQTVHKQRKAAGMTLHIYITQTCRRTRCMGMHGGCCYKAKERTDGHSGS